MCVKFFPQAFIVYLQVLIEAKKISLHQTLIAIRGTISLYEFYKNEHFHLGGHKLGDYIVF